MSYLVQDTGEADRGWGGTRTFETKCVRVYVFCLSRGRERKPGGTGGREVDLVSMSRAL